MLRTEDKLRQMHTPRNCLITPSFATERPTATIFAVVDIANGESYDASIPVKVPDSSAPFVLGYKSTSTDYNIICQPE